MPIPAHSVASDIASASHQVHNPIQLPPTASSSVQAPTKHTTQPKSPRRPSKRARTQATDAGIGPAIRARPEKNQAKLDAAEQAAATIPTNYSNKRPDLASKAPKEVLTGGADCWALIIGTTHQERPSLEEITKAKATAEAHATASPSNLRRPSPAFERLLCIPCLKADVWHTWSNTNGGSTHGARTHFIKTYRSQYLASCKRIGYTVLLDQPEDTEPDEIIDEPITTEGIARHLAELVAEEDLSFNIVESPGLRRLLSYIGQGNLMAASLPGRTMVTRVAAEQSERAKQRIKQKMKDAKGRVSITSDLWSDDMERSFMTVTGHFISKEDEMSIEVMAFRLVEGSHTGTNVGGILFEILADYDILHKIGSITLDNASNNNTLMEELQTRMQMEGYTFDKEGNRIRCKPHVINIAVGTFLSKLPESGSKYREKQLNSGHQPSERTEQYLRALETEPDKRCRETVVALRHGQRRQGLRQTILEGNTKGYFVQKQSVRDEDGRTVDTKTVVYQLDQLELLHDCKTRWSSTRNMIARFLYLYPAVSNYIYQNKEGLAQHAITHLQFKVLQDILAVLDIPHRAQELLSAEQTPTLSLAFPVYDSLICQLHDAAKSFPALAYAIEAAIEKFEEYVLKSRTSPIHIVAMFLNPCLKYSWIDEHWPEADRLNARVVVKRFIMKHLVAREDEATEPSVENLSTKASKALNRGLGNVLFTHEGVTQAPDFDGSMGVTPPCSPATTRVAPTPARAAIYPASFPLTTTSVSQDTLTRRTLIVDLEHDEYLAAPGWTFEKLGEIDLVKYWTTQTKHSLLHAVAMDVLPAQASSVSSERVFSSSKLTCTRARNKIGAQTVEMLQILKHSLRHGRKDNSAIKTNSDRPTARTLDIMARLDDSDWGDDAILDTDVDV